MATTSYELDPADGVDALYCNVSLPLREIFHPLGFSLEIATNSEEVMKAARVSWGHIKKRFPQPALELRINVDSNGSLSCPQAPKYRAQKYLLSVVADEHNYATCDLARGFSFAWITPGIVKNQHYLRYHFLEGIVMSMLACSYTVSLHAACVELNGRGVMLCGDSGAGKTSLAFACARAGWTYISDDACYLLRDQSDRFVIGNSHQVRFRPSAAELFPELKGYSITPRTAGKPSIEVPIDSLPGGLKSAFGARVKHVVYLNRRKSGSQELTSYPKESALKKMNYTPYAVEGVEKSHAAAIENLLEASVFELHYHDLDWAVHRLEALVKEKDPQW
jgi:hypothetical protein